IWSDDFSVPANWTPSTLAGFDAQNWVVGNTAPAGSFAIPAITSTSAANGWALYDSDLFCGGNQQAVIATANPINMTGYPGAVLQFEQFFRKYVGQCFVDVSVNNTDWTEFEVNADMAVNTNTPNSDIVALDVSSAVANQPAVWLRFRYWSTTADHGPNGGCDYAWMVDDVQLLELEPFNLVVNYGVISHTGNGEEYGRTPQNQLYPQMNLGAEVHNFGSSDQTALSVQITIKNSANVTIYDQAFPLGDLAAGQLANLDELVTLPTLPPDVYSVAFVASSNESGGDAFPDDNTVNRKFAINNDVYSLDGIDVYDANDLAGLGSASFAGAADGLIIFTYYEIATATTAYAVSAEIGNGTDVNSSFTVSIYDTAAVQLSTLGTPIYASDIFTVTAADLTAGRVMGLIPGGVNLPVGGYYAAITLYSSANANDIVILDDATVPQPGGASLIWDPSTPQTFSNGNASAVRLQLNSSIGIKELSALEGVVMFPNPSTGVFRINTKSSGAHQVEVSNVLGERVMNQRFTATTTVDLGGLSKGVYMVRVSNTTGSMVQRVTIE
ncbi:MAG TPA: T9SS type A sorting domain-containing protein, partial [Flavobacteriales bacterium]|nr:T9SS type A sorting domain-containing protein [Flavobacteriales bacterium]